MEPDGSSPPRRREARSAPISRSLRPPQSGGLTSCERSLPFVASLLRFGFDAPNVGSAVLGSFPAEKKLILPVNLPCSTYIKLV